MEISQWLTLDALGKFSDALVVLRFAVEYTKDGADFLSSKAGFHIHTKVYAVLLALFGLLLPYHLFTGHLTGQQVYLDVINAFVLSFGAGFMVKPVGNAEIAAMVTNVLKEQTPAQPADPAWHPAPGTEKQNP